MKSERYSIRSAALISGKLANETGKEASKQDGPIEETHVTSTLNINDSRDVNDVKWPFVNEIQREEAISKEFQQTAVSYKMTKCCPLRPFKAKYKLLPKK